MRQHRPKRPDPSLSGKKQTVLKGEKKPPPQDPTEIPNQASTTMEVHHHAHHGHGRKTWKSYFWEFFMFFLAVFCGFMAEVQVEHYIEHQREKKYMQMCIEDLRADSLRFGRIIRGNQQRMESLDQLITLLNSADRADSTIQKMYDINSWRIGFANFLFNKRTMSQLKTAGGYKLIREKAVADSLVERDIDIDWNDGMRQRLHESFVRVREAGVSIFDEYQLYAYRKSLATNQNNALDSALNSFVPITIKTAHKFSLLSQDKKEISQYSSSLIYFQKLLNRYNQDLISYQRKCHSLIKLIKKEYDIQ
jgi:hypothetical protein